MIIPLLIELLVLFLSMFTVTSADVTPSKISKLKSLNQPQNFDTKIVKDIMVTQLKIIKRITANNPNEINEDKVLNLTQLIEKYGYKVEEYQVITPDGYILTLQRVPGNGTVVFLMHSLFGSADVFVEEGPDNALVFSLASLGYDVWLGNVRGSKYSRKHLSLSPDNAEFWDYSWHEMGIYDVPTMIDFVLDKSSQTKLTYIGYSLGTTTFFVMASLLTEYNSKISLMVALAPIAYMSHLISPFARMLSLETDLVHTLLKSLGMHEFTPNNAMSKTMTTVKSGNNVFDDIMHSNFMFLLVGFDRGYSKNTNLPRNTGTAPGGSSTKQVAHYGQEIQSAKFCMFDYGEKKNKELYGVPSPPEYPVDNITAPIRVALFYSDNDWLSSEIDVKILRNQLPNVVEFCLVDGYCHYDYVRASNVKEKINEPILQLIPKYE